MEEKVTFEQFCDPAYVRQKLMEEKSGAVFAIFTELDGLINKTKLAEEYFERTQGWISQRINGCMLRNKKQSFTTEEYHQLAEAFRSIAARLAGYADEIDKAKIEED